MFFYMALFVFGLDEGGIEKKKKGLRETERETQIRKRFRVKIRLKEIEKAIETGKESLFERASSPWNGNKGQE